MWTYGICESMESPSIRWIEDNIRLVGQENHIRIRDMQRVILKDQHKYRIVLAPRQLGMTTTMICEAVYRLVNEPGTKIIYGSHPTYHVSHVYDIFIRLLNSKVTGKTKVNATIQISNGSNISFQTLNDRSTCGHTCNYLYIDNASYVTDSCLDAIIPSVTANNGTLLLGSTGDSRNDHYNEWTRRKTNNVFRYIDFTEGVIPYW